MKHLLRLLALAAVGLPATFAQTFPFTIRVQQPDSVATIGNGGGITLNTPVGTNSLVNVILTYTGAGTTTITIAPELVGSTAFTLENVSSTPATLTNGTTFRFDVRYTPTRTSAVSAQINIPFTENVVLNGNPPTAVTNRGIISLNFAGTAPDLVLSYFYPDEQNFIPLPSGGRIIFPATALNAASNVTLSIANRGSGPGTLDSLTVGGAGFQTLGLPLLPLSIGSGQETRIVLRFQPRTPGLQTGLLTALFNQRTNFTATLEGNAFLTTFGYQLITPDRTEDLTPGQTIVLGDALPGEQLTAQIVVTNQNPQPATISNISITGTGFSITDLPTNRTLAVGDSLSFTLTASITQTGPIRGRLRINDDVFDVTASGIGARLQYSYVVADTPPVTVAPGGSIFFPPTAIGERRTVTVLVRNTGNTDSSIVSIALGDLRTGFRLFDLPLLPARLRANEELLFRVEFQPITAGISSATLRIDNAQFTLSGSSSSTTAPLPSYQFTLAPGTVNPLDQLQIGITLNTAYPTTLTGVLSIAQETASFGSDPAVRFANGLTTVNFTIPANSTQAIFPNGSREIRFQTGSVAGTLLLTAVFALPGGTGLPEDTPQVLRLTVPALAPRIFGAQVAAGTNALTIGLTAISTPRSLTRADIEFTAAPGFELATTKLTIPLDGESINWFRSQSSQGFGGIFRMTIPLTLSNLNLDPNNNVVTPLNLLSALASIRISLTNEIGTSNQITIVLQQ